LISRNDVATAAAQTIRFTRRYRAALLDYLLGSGETGLARAFDLGRAALAQKVGLLQILRSHQKAMAAILESSRTVNESLRRLQSAEEFLTETLSPYEMACRGYLELVERELGDRQIEIEGEDQKDPGVPSRR
jgi:hypothetical protein